MENNINWDVWISEFEEILLKKKYYKYHQDYKNETFSFWKVFNSYQVGVLFYDFRKFKQLPSDCSYVSVSYETMILDVN